MLSVVPGFARYLAMAICLAVAIALALPAGLAAAPEGQMNFAAHVTLAPRWLDPAETESAITPFMVLYAIHDALVKPMPGGLTTPSLAESWTISRTASPTTSSCATGAKFHNGEPVTSDDVKFSFERYHGGAAKLLKDRVREVQVVDPRRVRFVLKEPWPDFMTFYGTTATGAGWIVPKKYVEKVGDAGFKKAPIGAGPYRFVSVNPGDRADPRGLRGVLAQGPERQARRPQERSRRDDPRRRPQARRGRRRLLPERPHRRGRPPHPRPQAHGRCAPTPSSSSTSSTSGIRSRRGPTSACASPPAWPSTGRPSTRPSPSGSPG